MRWWGLAAVVPIVSLQVSPDGERLLAGGGDRVQIISSDQQQVERTIPSALQQVFAAAYSADAKTIAVAGGSPGQSGAVELISGEQRASVDVAGDVLYAAAYSVGGTLALGSADGVVYLLEQGQVRPLPGHVGPVLAVAWSPDGSLLASGSADRSVRVWEASTGALRLTLTNHSGAVNAVVFSADGKELYSASDDKTVRIWLAVSGRMRRIIRGHDAAVLSMTRAGAQLITGASDGRVRAVSPASGEVELIAERQGWIDAIVALGKRIASGGSTLELDVFGCSGC